MLQGHAIDFHDVIDNYVSHNLELSEADWNAIELVTGWLKTFRSDRRSCRRASSWVKGD